MKRGLIVLGGLFCLILGVSGLMTKPGVGSQLSDEQRLLLSQADEEECPCGEDEYGECLPCEEKAPEEES